MKELERVLNGEKRVPEIDMSPDETARAYIALVMSKFILEVDFDGDLYYSLNPESQDYTPPPTEPEHRPIYIKSEGVQAAFHPFNARSGSTPRGRRP